jgi:hypothetical protein
MGAISASAFSAVVDGTVAEVELTSRRFAEGLPEEGGRWVLIRCQRSWLTPGDWMLAVEDGSGNLEEPAGVFLTNDELRGLENAIAMALIADLAR